MKALSDEHPTADDLIPSVRRSVEEARQFLVEQGDRHDPVARSARGSRRRRPTPASGSFASMDTPGPYETKATEAFYYVTPVEKDWDAKHEEEHLRLYNPPVVAMINVHEAYPGHYLQFLYAPRFPTKTRKLVFCGTNVEGWAHYTEQMMVDEGFGGGDPKIRLAQLQEALLRDCRYVVGIKLHTAGHGPSSRGRSSSRRRASRSRPTPTRRRAAAPTTRPTSTTPSASSRSRTLRDEYLATKGGTPPRVPRRLRRARGGCRSRWCGKILFRWAMIGRSARGRSAVPGPAHPWSRPRRRARRASRV